jgi:Fe-S-cluster containining protein
VDEARRILGALPDPPRRGPIGRAVRRVLREIMWIFIVVMDLGRRFGAVLLRTEYVVEGACKKRGACCHHILLTWTPLLDRFPFLARIVLWKYTRLYSFFDRGYSWEVEEGFLARVMGCHALLPDGRCGEHRLRPLVCRAYPELPLLGKPMVLKGCGYHFARRDGRAEEPPKEELVQIRRRLEP